MVDDADFGSLPSHRQLLRFLISCSYMELDGTVSESLPFGSGNELFDKVFKLAHREPCVSVQLK